MYFFKVVLVRKGSIKQQFQCKCMQLIFIEIFLMVLSRSADSYRGMLSSKQHVGTSSARQAKCWTLFSWLWHTQTCCNVPKVQRCQRNMDWPVGNQETPHATHLQDPGKIYSWSKSEQNSISVHLLSQDAGKPSSLSKSPSHICLQSWTLHYKKLTMPLRGIELLSTRRGYHKHILKTVNIQSI